MRPALPSLPHGPDQLDPAALTWLLADRHPGCQVATVDVLEVHETTNTHVRLGLTYNHAAGAPATLFCKLPPLVPARRAVIAATGMGVREARFYGELAPALTLRTPAVHGTAHDASGGDFVLLLEDLRATGCTIPDGPVGITPDAAAVALEELAHLHVRYEDPARRVAEAPWVQPAGPGSDYAIDKLRYGIDHHRGRLTDAFVALSELYIRRRPALQDLWHTGPRTIVHGDLHLGNVFDDHGRTGFLDWGILMVSPPMRDVSYFLTMAMDVEARRACEGDLLRHYLDARSVLGGASMTFDQAWSAHRVQAAYTVPASCQVVQFPDDATERRRVFAEAFLARASAAIDDLGALEAVRALGA